MSRPDFGDLVTGWLLDEAAWLRADRIRLARPASCATGAVVAVYPYAPAVVGIRTAGGDRVHVKLDGGAPVTARPICRRCGHEPHPAGDCSAGVWPADQSGPLPCRCDPVWFEVFTGATS